MKPTGGADPPPPPPQTHPQIQQGPYPAGSLRREVFAESRWRNGGEARWDGAGGGGMLRWEGGQCPAGESRGKTAHKSWEVSAQNETR